MKYPTLIPSSSQVMTLDEKQVQSLYQLCHRCEDGRAARGKRYPLAALLTLVLVAKLAGMHNLLAASEWIVDQRERLCEHLGLSWKRMPCTNTYAYAFAHADSDLITAPSICAFLSMKGANLPMNSYRCPPCASKPAL